MALNTKLPPASRATLALAALILCAPLAGQSAPPGKIAPAVSSALDSSGRVVACVVLESPERPGDSVEARCARFHELQGRVLAGLPAGTCRVRYRFRYSPAVVLEIFHRDALDALDASGSVRGIHESARGGGALIESRALLEVDRAIAELGVTGKGRTVAVIDSGIDVENEDFDGALVDASLHRHFLDEGDARGVGAMDENGHGTGVAGIVGSRGHVAPAGVAPAARILPVRVLDEENVGYVVDWTAGVEYVVDLHREGTLRVDAINLSLATFRTYESLCDETNLPFSEACRAAAELGIAVVAASGNNGSETRLSSPACFTSTISVASIFDRVPLGISGFSNRNEHLDLLAPGQPIESTRLGGGSRTFTGTSFAAPHVTAIISLMREAAPTITPSEALIALERTANLLVDPDTDLAFPVVNAFRAIEPLVTSGDCDENGINDWVELEIRGTAEDCDANGVPDACDVRDRENADCDGSGVLDSCEIALELLFDVDGDGVPDICDQRVEFLRGDPNDDGALNLSDGLFVFNWLFVDGSASPGCLESADLNNDATVDITDGIYALEYLFQKGDPPAPPGPPGGASACARDPDALWSEGDIGCAIYESCPSLP